MKLNSDFLINDTGNGEMLIPVGEETKKFHGVIKLNETGSEIVHLIENNDLSMEQLLEHFYNEYPDENKDSIKEAITAFINKLREVNAITL
ncbi:MAG: PqqD family protein [Bacilli bacterium]|nr:PqqD family protein [Bacilli bacterium]